MASKVVSGILLKAEDNSEPIPVPVTGHVSIQEYVGGHFDVVTEKYHASEFLSETDDEFDLVGYCHDEGLLLNMPLNKMATMVFRRELRGDVVIVSGTAPSGTYDGNNHDLPSWFTKEVFNGTLMMAVQAVDAQASYLRDALARCIVEGLVEASDAMVVIEIMERLASEGNVSDDEISLVKEIMDMAETYHTARLRGMPKFTDEQIKIVKDLSDMETDWEVTDEELEKFLTENGGK